MVKLREAIDDDRKVRKDENHKHKWDHKNRVCSGCCKSLDKSIDEISKALRKAASDPKVIERGEELQRILSTLTPEDLLRRFDI